MADTRTTIIEVSTKLYAERGYDGVSMRNIADKVKISAPALYNHFNDKQSLYLAVISETFTNKSDQLLDVAKGPGKPIERLERLIRLHCQLMHDDPTFRRLIQRELLDADDKRLEYLAQEVFAPAFNSLKELLLELKPDCDADTLAIIIHGMTQKHYELHSLIQYFPDTKHTTDDPQYITQQVMAVLSPFLGE